MSHRFGLTEMLTDVDRRTGCAITINENKNGAGKTVWTCKRCHT